VLTSSTEVSASLRRTALGRLVGFGKEVITSSAKVWYGKYRMVLGRCGGFGKDDVASFAEASTDLCRLALSRWCGQHHHPLHVPRGTWEKVNQKGLTKIL